jgi:pimeloyl-ACP methyl ester carboxylesterase
VERSRGDRIGTHAGVAAPHSHADRPSRPSGDAAKMGNHVWRNAYGRTLRLTAATAFVLLALLTSVAHAVERLADPILFVHGLTSCSRTWGAVTCDPATTQCSVGREGSEHYGVNDVCGFDPNSHEDYRGHSTVMFYTEGSALQQLAAYYGVPSAPVFDAHGRLNPRAGINLNKLEVFNSADGNGTDPIRGSGNLAAQLYGRLEEVLEKYCPAWRSEPGCKVTVVAHSKGGVVVREMINAHRLPTDSSNAVNHIRRVVTLGAPHDGSEWAEPVDAISSRFVRNTKSAASDYFNLLKPLQLCFAGNIGRFCIGYDPFEKLRLALDPLFSPVTQTELGKNWEGSLIRELAQAYPSYPDVGLGRIPFINVVTTAPEGVGATLWGAATDLDLARTHCCLNRPKEEVGSKCPFDAASLVSMRADAPLHAAMCPRPDTLGKSQIAPNREQCHQIRDYHEVCTTLPPLPTLCFLNEYTTSRKAVCATAADADEWARISDLVITRPAQSMETIFGKRPRLRTIVQEEKADPLLKVDEIVDPTALLPKLQSGTDPVSRFIWANLRSAAREQLTSQASWRQRRETIVEELNRLIAGSSIYDAERFAGVDLRAETKSLIDKRPLGADLLRLNRLLLEDAYYLYVARNEAVPHSTWEFLPGIWGQPGRADLVLRGLHAPLPGDINEDGVIDIDDVREIMRRIGHDDPFIDFDGDGRVSVLDARILVDACNNKRCAK